MAPPNFAFGFDFGTSKTAMSVAQTGSTNPPVSELPIDGQNSRISTYVLCEVDGARVWIGEKARQRYQGADPEERQGLRLFANFKPHIHQRSEDREAARQFMLQIRRLDGLAHELDRHSGDSVVAVGFPVSWNKAGADTLLELLRQAKFPPAFAVPEPVGAAFHFLGVRLNAEDFNRDIVVFDWGAGTFDMSILRAGEFEFEQSNSWGSTLFGGRLFDDLFYQWYTEMAVQNGRAEDVRRLNNSPLDRAIVQELECREIKENFSRFLSTAASNEPWTYVHQVDINGEEGPINLGRFKVPRIGDFFDRMRAYTPSDRAGEWIEKAQDEIQPEERVFVEALKARRPVDLRAWGAVLIDEGLSKLRVGSGSTAILTGGSSNWKWFQSDVGDRSVFAGRGSCLYDAMPELTIARGLARAYSIGSYSAQLIGELTIARVGLAEGLKEIHGRLVSDLAAKVARLCVSDASLQRSVEGIFLDGMSKAESHAPVRKDAGAGLRHFFEILGKFFSDLTRIFSGPKRRLEEYQNQLKAQFETYRSRFADALRDLLHDPNVEAIRPELEKCIGRWLADNRVTLLRVSDEVSKTAREETMRLLNRYVQIGGVVQIALDACGATGEMSLTDVLRPLGGDVEIEMDLFTRLWRDASKWLGEIGRPQSRTGPHDRAEALCLQARASADSFFAALPEAVRNNVEKAQDAQGWADRVLDNLMNSLRRLVRVAGVENSPNAGDV